MNKSSFNSRRKTFLLMAMLLTGGMASAQVAIKGNVYGGGELGVVTKNTNVTINGGTIGTENSGGSVFGGGEGSNSDHNAARVNGNTTVNLNGGKVLFNVYGGGNLGSVGVGNVDDKTTGVAKVIASGGQVGKDSGVTTTGPNAGLDAYIFGGGKGFAEGHTNFANVDSTYVEIKNDVVIKGSVFGGGEDGHVLQDTYVNIAPQQYGWSCGWQHHHQQD